MAVVIVLFFVLDCSNSSSQFSQVKNRIARSNSLDEIFETIATIDINPRYPIGDLLYLKKLNKAQQIVIYDMMANQVLLVDFAGNIISKIGNSGEGPEEYQDVLSIECDRDDNIYLLEKPPQLQKIKVFRPDGSFVKTISLDAAGMNLKLTSDEKCFILYDSRTLAEGSKIIAVLDTNGKLLQNFGSSIPPEKIFGIHLALYMPLLAVNTKNEIYVTSIYTGYYRKYELSGKLLQTISINNNLPEQFKDYQHFRQMIFVDKIFSVRGIFSCKDIIIISKTQDKKNYFDFFNSKGRLIKEYLPQNDHLYLLDADSEGFLYFSDTSGFEGSITEANPKIIIKKLCE